MSDQKLLQYYLNMREPEAYQWNISPRSLYLDFETRDFLIRNFEVFVGMKACNIGIGVGEWDDFLGYFLKDYGQLTSIDIDQEICEIFEFRQQREGHTNSSVVICGDFLTCMLPSMEYDLVTMIGSALNEIGEYRKTFEKISDIMKPNGQLMYMDFNNYHKKEELLSVLHDLNMELERLEEYDRYPSITFYCMKIRRTD
ncbi:class I SAM-dependent methyltransferase [Paenibacillus sp. KQZ6P-2]|uniref:Class I SAM-dependent methyltransferase n=1 Tax=Paenibacillus mangrovi TaxID=2931978 RepID=A0A9X1WR84_9BACL|nr:class I SAM-dependent methyltransferase [Paenibacillus mangrovi]MCJ8013211.1 class I SAM-dependent methyltransferase [Paenibacillus mangrovi]